MGELILTFALAGLGDVPALLALIQSAYRGDTARSGWTHEADLLEGQRTDAEALAAMLSDPNFRVLTAAEDEALIGCVSVEDRGEGLAYLGLLTVAPERQAAGLGRALITAAERAARAAFGARRIEMTVIAQRPELIAYYERRGYRLTGERRPFPHGDERFGRPRDPALAFVVLEKGLR
jgi:GNAT superfamily N-acetyltransferase